MSRMSTGRAMMESLEETDESRSESPEPRQSYVDFASTSGLHPCMRTFDERVIKRLDMDELSDSSAGEETLKTFLRIRPAIGTDEFLGSDMALEIKDEHTVLAHAKMRGNFPDRPRKQVEFKFSKVLGPQCHQLAVYEECVTPIVEKFLRHENCLIFSYGATNSGKTYTMQGHGTQYGIIPRTLDAIFCRINDRQYKIGNIRPHLYQGFLQLNQNDVEALLEKRDRIIAEANIKQELMESYRLSHTGFSEKSGSTVDLVGGHVYDPNMVYPNATLYSVWVSYAELYNERVYDLLDNVNISRNKRRKELKLLQDRNGYAYIKDLTELPVTSDEEAYKLFLAGRKNLQFAATQMNCQSSRSHSFFTIRVVSLGIGDGLVPYPKTVHRMTFCDLAGMERATQTENEGVRLKESGNINNSLIVLLKVIRLLREKQMNQNANHRMIETIPFRESKLTHIFKSYLTSSTHICMIVNVNPDPAVAESTLQVLQNSAIASNVIVFRPLDVHTEAQLVEQPEISKPKTVTAKPPLSSSKQQKGSDKTSEKEKSNDSMSDPEDYAAATVVAPKTMIERNKILEEENRRLRGLLVEKDRQHERFRDEMFKMLADERVLWSKRLQQAHVMEQNFNRRRLSLNRHQTQLSPVQRCGRCSPPTSEMEDIAEKYEGDIREAMEANGESDKEN